VASVSKDGFGGDIGERMWGNVERKVIVAMRPEVGDGRLTGEGLDTAGRQGRLHSLLI